MVDAWNLTILKPLSPDLGAGDLGSPERLLTAQPGERATLPVGAHYQIFDLGAATALRQLALLYTTAEAGDTVRITASNNADGVTAAVLDSGLMELDEYALARPEGYRHFFYHRVNGSVNARYIRVSTTIAGADAYAGRLAVGNPFQPENNANFGDAAWGYDEGDAPELLDSGVEVLYENEPAPIFQFTLSWLSEEELEQKVEPLGRLQHEGVPVLVARRPDAHDYRHNALYYGILRMRPPVAQDFDSYEVQAQIRSMV